MALGLQDVLSKKRNVSQKLPYESLEAASVSVEKENLRPWDISGTNSHPISTAKVSQKHEFIDDNPLERAERAVMKARKIVAQNSKMIDEIHSRRQVGASFNIMPSAQVQRPSETFTEIETQDPVLKLGKKGLWEMLSEILN